MARRRRGRSVGGRVLAVLLGLVWQTPLALLLLSLLWVLTYRFVDPPTTWLMQRDRGQGIAVERRWVALRDLPLSVPMAAIAAEDEHFCTHHGLDTEAIRKAMEANADGGKLRGGSTISQQTAKNAFLWPERSWVRKGLEAYFTAMIELLWPKRRIMEVYLNIVEWGPGVYGIDAAARHHFHKPAAQLSRREAARLASILPSPLRWNPVKPSREVKRKARRVDRWSKLMPPDNSACLR